MKPCDKFNSFDTSDKENFWSSLDVKIMPTQGIFICTVSTSGLENFSTSSVEFIYRSEEIDWDQIANQIGLDESKILRDDWQQELDSLNYLVLLYCDGSYVTCISG